jgi:hypothetical protein
MQAITTIGSKLRPRIRGTHIDNADCLHPRLWRFDAKQSRLLPSLDAAPELPLGGDDEVLTEWIGVGFDLNPLPAAGDDRKSRCPGRDDPQCCSCGMYFSAAASSENDQGSMNLASKTVPVASMRPSSVAAIQQTVLDMLLHVHNGLAGIDLIPAAIELMETRTLEQ